MTCNCELRWYLHDVEQRTEKEEEEEEEEEEARVLVDII
jgi:hypothetical protein